MSVRQYFEQELRNRLEQKRNLHQSPENILMKSFKYYDLDNTGTVDLQEFIKAVQKIGIVINSQEEIERIFQHYDTSGDGFLNYEEFASIIFGNQSASTRKFSPQKPTNSQDQLIIENYLEKFRKKLAARGVRGIIGLLRSFKILDENDSRYLDIYQFTKAIKDYRIDASNQEIQVLFNAFDINKDGSLSYEEFARAMRGPMSSYRKSLVNQAFNKFDKDGSGFIDINDIKNGFNAQNHSDVRQGKKSEEEVLLEFIETFEMYHSISGNTIGERVVNREEWEEYYNNVSACIDSDEYFQLLMINSWKLNEGAPSRKGQASVSLNYKQNLKKQPEIENVQRNDSRQQQKLYPQTGGKQIEVLFEKFRAKLAGRGSRGIIGLQRSFKIMDSNNSQSLDKQEFIKAIKDYRIDIQEIDIGRIFDAFDRDGSGELSYDEFLRVVRGPMNQNRRALVQKAFKKLDKDGSDMIDINDIKGIYDAKNHPDVKSGKKTEDDILEDFLETFEQHHNVSNIARKDQKVTLEEFEEYYNNISISIGNFQFR